MAGKRPRISTVLTALVFAAALTTYLLVRPLPASIAHTPDNAPVPATSRQSTPSRRPETPNPRPSPTAVSPGSPRPQPSDTPSTHRPSTHASTPVALPSR